MLQPHALQPADHVLRQRVHLARVVPNALYQSSSAPSIALHKPLPLLRGTSLRVRGVLAICHSHVDTGEALLYLEKMHLKGREKAEQN